MSDIDWSKITRVGFMPPGGKYQEWWNVTVEHYVQDDGRTLNVFLKDPRSPEERSRDTALRFVQAVRQTAPSDALLKILAEVERQIREESS